LTFFQLLVFSFFFWFVQFQLTKISKNSDFSPFFSGLGSLISGILIGFTLYDLYSYLYLDYLFTNFGLNAQVSLDPVQQTSPKCVYLLCWLDDRNLPCIPPVQIAIPEDYPNSSPKCNLSNYEYGATKFLQMIQKALQSRISKLSSKYTMSQLLDTWENSVRETCSSDRINSLSTVF